MNRTARTILFFSCLTVFMILCPIILAYSMGYVFDINNKKIIPTGSISIKSIPRSANITLNGIAIEKPTPALITNLSAGIYDVEVFKDGYLPWNKTLKVKDFHLSIAGNILLFPTNPQSQNITDTLQWIEFSPSKLFAIGLQKDIASPLFLNLSINEMPAFSSIDNDYSIVSINPESISWSAREKYVSFFATLNNGQRGYYFFEISNPQNIKPIAFEKYENSQIVWHSKNDDILIYVSDSKITQKNIISDEEITIANDSNKVFSNNNKIYFIQKGSGIIYFVSDPWMIPSKNSEIEKNQFTETAIPIDVKYDITNLANDQFLMRGNNNIIFLVGNNSVKKIQEDALGVDINNQGKILTFNKYEINLIIENGSKKQLITRLGEKIKKAFWMTNNHVAYLLENGNFFITELDSRDGKNTIAPIKDTMENCWISEDSNNVYPVLYFINKGTLYKVDWEK